jgi:hypothetical protein
MSTVAVMPGFNATLASLGLRCVFARNFNGGVISLLVL